jgi:hypothetical protein
VVEEADQVAHLNGPPVERDRLERALEHGGAATVCLAEDLLPERRVAPGVVLPELRAGPGFGFAARASGDVR